METNNIKKYEDYIGKEVIGFKFDSQHPCEYSTFMNDYIGVVGTIIKWNSGCNAFGVKFEDEVWYYPTDLVIKQLNQKEKVVEMMEKDEEAGLYNDDSEQDMVNNSNNFKEITDSIASLLQYKNEKYGNSALEPIEVFGSKCKVGTRIDDKLSRIKNSSELNKNDVVDLIGYTILICKEKGWDNFDEFKD